MPNNIINLKGRKFFRLLVLKQCGRNIHGSVLWLTKCDCGNEKIISSPRLIGNHTVSCGCWRRERLGNLLRTHGDTNSSEFNRWSSMIQRCTNPDHKAYPNYGGRGVNICKRWLVYDNFLSDMGRASKGMSIERINNNKGYSPNNCKWASTLDQNRNRRNNIKIKYNGVTRTLSEWATITGIKYTTLHKRAKNKLSPKQILYIKQKSL